LTGQGINVVGVGASDVADVAGVSVATVFRSGKAVDTLGPLLQAVTVSTGAPTNPDNKVRFIWPHR
jgi:hypothetical protein